MKKQQRPRVSYRIRQYQSADWEAVCRLIQKTIRRFLSEDQSKKTTENLIQFFDATNVKLQKDWAASPVKVFVAVHNRVLVGVIRGVPKKHILQLYVDGQYQGQGIGRTLVRRFEMTAKKQGLRCIKVNAAPRAVLFYGKLGFRKSTGEKIDKEDGARYQPMMKSI